jgi:hypothetical protein
MEKCNTVHRIIPFRTDDGTIAGSMISPELETLQK